MSQKFNAILLGSAMCLVSFAAPAAAANKEHQQLMADIRMLQEQSQTLQNLLGQLNETLRAVNTRLDQQAESTRKAFADQKLIIDKLTDDARIIRDKLDDNSVRVGSISQEVDAMRRALENAMQQRAPTVELTPSAPGDPSAPAPPPTPAPTGPTPIASPKQMWDAAYADYTAGQYDLAILGFEAYIKSFPRADQADNAQVMICASYLNDKKDDRAAEACDLAIRTYPGGDAIPEAYYRKGLALANMRDVAGARAAWETVVTRFKDTDAARLAQQRLDQTRRPD
jgi:TolA-binding protein